MANDLSQDERAELEALRSERVKSGKGGLYLKGSTKGGISLYGLQRFPVTSYKEQWEKVVAHADTVWDEAYTTARPVVSSILSEGGVLRSASNDIGIGVDGRAGCAIL